MFTGPAVSSKRMSPDCLWLLNLHVSMAVVVVGVGQLSLYSQTGGRMAQVLATCSMMYVSCQLLPLTAPSDMALAARPTRNEEMVSARGIVAVRRGRCKGSASKASGLLQGLTHLFCRHRTAVKRGGNDYTRALTWPTDPALAKVPAGKRRKAPCHLVILRAVETSRLRSTPWSAFSGSASCWAKQDWSTGQRVCKN